MENEKAHAKYSASGAHRWMNCPGSIRLSEEAPPPYESPQAIEGTEAHELLEKILRGNKSKLLKQHHAFQNVTKAVTLFNKFKRETPDAQEFIEEKVSLEFVHEDMFGTVDWGLAEFYGRLRVWDYKHGQGHVVEVSQTKKIGTLDIKFLNPQLAYYALGLAHKFNYEFEDIEIGIVQPRAPHSLGPIRSEVFSVSEIKSHAELFKKAVDRCEKKDAKLLAGDWCQFCPAKVICPKITEKALVSAQQDFEVIETENTIKLPDPQDLNEDVIAKVYPSIKLLEWWVAAIKNEAFQLALDGKLKGFKLVHGRKNKKWKPGAEEELELLYGEDAYKKKILSPAQALETFKGHQKELKKLIEESKPLVTIVPESDPRPKVFKGSEFSIIEGEEDDFE